MRKDIKEGARSPAQFLFFPFKDLDERDWEQNKGTKLSEVLKFYESTQMS